VIKKIFLLPLLLGTLLFTGCIESGTMLVVNTDGSGTIIARAFMNTQVMEGFAGGFGGLGEGAGGAPPDMTESLKASLEGAAEIFGEVKFESIKEVKNKLGWKGYEATYSFTDANKVRMTSPDVEMDGGGGPEMKGGDTIYDIKFSAGNPATIEFIAEIPEEDDGADEAGGEEEAFQPQMMAMMAPMLKGMRVSYLVKVNGKITESNGKYLNKESGTLLLMDMQVDKLLANPDAAKLMGNGKKPDFKELSKKKIPGLKFHNPEENVKISFK
jgi:hypothetical protein